MKSISVGVFVAFLTLVTTSSLKRKDVIESCVQTVGVTITVWITEQTSHPPTSPIVQKQADNSQALGSVEVPPTSSITSLSSILSRTSPTPAPTAAYIAPTTISTSTIPSPVVASVATAASATAPASASTEIPSTSNVSGSDACGQIGGTCSGDITVYDTTAGLTPEVFRKSGFGACGWLNNGTYENVFALAHDESSIQTPLFSSSSKIFFAGMMGEQSNGNPYCGRNAIITLYGKTAIGKLVDKCPVCDGQSIDLSDHLFADLGATTDTGRYHNVKWSFTT